MTNWYIPASIQWHSTYWRFALHRGKIRMIQMKRISEEVYFADQAIVHVGPEDINFLRNNVETTVRQRTRLCAHKGPEDGLHEMFVVYTNNTYMRPNKHPKDESLHI